MPTTGITSITLADEAYADACQRRIKLLGRAIAREDGTVCAYVEPHFISLQNPLAGVDAVSYTHLGTKWWHRRFDPVGTHPENFRFRDGADVNGSVGPQEAIGLPKEPPCAHTCLLYTSAHLL